MTAELLDNLKRIAARLHERGEVEAAWDHAVSVKVSDAIDRIVLADRLADAVGVLVEDSMERNGPQVDGDIVRAYRAYRE